MGLGSVGGHEVERRFRCVRLYHRYAFGLHRRARDDRVDLNTVLAQFVARQVVIRAGGVKYAEFLKNVRTALFKSESQS
ncbi:hypothetical protein ABIA96_000059 [Bradyrhizobium sp. LB11.1]